MWEFYLAGAAVAFRNDDHVVWQIQLGRTRDTGRSRLNRHCHDITADRSVSLGLLPAAGQTPSQYPNALHSHTPLRLSLSKITCLDVESTS